MSRPRLIALLLALVTLAVYLPVTRHGFLCYDDEDYVTGNRMVQHGLTLDGVRWAFTTFHADNWHPVTWLSHMADCELFNLNAGAHHYVNVLFHSANAALLFLLLWRLTQKLWPAALVAALFAWHPLHVESVAWVAERKDVLSTFFALLALWSYTRYVQAKSRRSFWFALVFFALGLLAKPMLVTLPCVMLLLDFWPLQRFSLATFRLSLLSEKTPFFLLTAASCGVTFLAQRAGHAVVPLAMYPLHSRLENVPVAVARYLSKMLWPADLAVVYPPEKFPAAIWGSALAGLLLISILVWRARDRHRCWLVGWLWFLGTLVPVIGLVQVGGTILADRYTYIPAVGIFIAVVFGGYELPRIQRFFPAVAVVLLAGCVLLTEKQLGYWRDSETLFRHTIAITQNNEAAHLNLGSVLDSQGRFGDALDEYHEALRINPNHNLTHFPIGRVLEKMHQPAAALDEYRQCLRLDPDIPAVHNAVGSVLAAQGKYDDAAREFAEAVRLDPHFAIPHIEQAKLFFQQGRDAQAVTELWAAARAEPYDYTTLSIVAHYLAANENAAGRDGANALVLALKADELSDHRQPEISDILGMAFAETGDFTNAMICAQNALEFAPAPQLKDTEPIQRRLALYRNHQPWRESFGATNAPAKN